MIKTLTATAIEKFKPGPVRREIADGLLPNFYLIVQPSGKKSWAVRYRLGKRSCKFTIGAVPAFGLAEAREAAKAALRAVSEGRDPAADRREVKAALTDAVTANTVEDAVQQYVKVYCRPENRSWRSTARRFGLKPDPDDESRFKRTGKGIVRDWSGRSIKSIKKGDIRNRLNSIKAKYPQAANQEYAFLRSFFGWCVQEDIISETPCVDIKKPAKPVKRDRVLSDEELKKVWCAAEQLGWPFGRLVQLLVLTGQRRNEVAGMRWSEIDVTAKRWIIPRHRRKNNAPQILPLSGAVLEVLGKLPRIKSEKKFVFTTSGGSPISGFSKWKSALDAALHKAGNDLPGWTLHDLRRTLATGLQKLGTPLQVTESVLGHTSGSSSGIVEIYQTHDWAPEKRVALDAWAKHVQAVVTGEADRKVVPIRGSHP